MNDLFRQFKRRIAEIAANVKLVRRSGASRKKLPWTPERNDARSRVNFELLEPRRLLAGTPQEFFSYVGANG